MDNENENVTAYCWIQLEPVLGFNGVVKGLKAARMSQKRPREPLGGVMLLQLRIQVPKSALAPLQATIEVPDGGFEITPVVRVAVPDGEHSA